VFQKKNNEDVRPSNLFLKLLNVNFCVYHAGSTAKITKNVVTSGGQQHVLGLKSYTNSQQQFNYSVTKSIYWLRKEKMSKCQQQSEVDANSFHCLDNVALGLCYLDLF